MIWLRAGGSLRAELLTWLIGPLAAFAAFNAWIEYDNARSIAMIVSERLLLAAANQLAEQIRYEDGRFAADVPPSALGIFASGAGDRALYQVRDPNGALIAGYPDVSAPPHPPAVGKPVNYVAAFHGDDVRAVALLAPIMTGSGERDALVIVGATLHGERRMIGELWREDAAELALMVLGAAALAWFGLARGLRPLLRLREHVRAGDVDALTPFAPASVQSELRPVVEAFNEASQRLRAQVEIRRRFIDDAAHQLRTPLTLLKTQASVGLAAETAPAKDEALAAIDRSVDELSRLAHQLTHLARSEAAESVVGDDTVDLGEIAAAALDSRALGALDRGVELGLEDQGAIVAGDAMWLSEAIANLIDNAIAYGGKGKVLVTASTLGETARLTIDDDGPGIPPEERENVFKRFFRLPGAAAPGSGLGLAIARRIARAHNATIRLADAPGGRGLRVEMTFRALAQGKGPPGGPAVSFPGKQDATAADQAYEDASGDNR